MKNLAFACYGGRGSWCFADGLEVGGSIDLEWAVVWTGHGGLVRG